MNESGKWNIVKTSNNICITTEKCGQKTLKKMALNSHSTIKKQNNVEKNLKKVEVTCDIFLRSGRQTKNCSSNWWGAGEVVLCQVPGGRPSCPRESGANTTNSGKLLTNQWGQLPARPGEGVANAGLTHILDQSGELIPQQVGSTEGKSKDKCKGVCPSLIECFQYRLTCGDRLLDL